LFCFLRRPDGSGRPGVAFTDRLGGASAGALASLNLGRTDLDDPAVLRANLAAVTDALGVSRVVMVHQVHGVDVLVADEAFADAWTTDSGLGDIVPGQPVADAIVTRRRGLALAVRVADCLPVVLADAAAGVVGVAHAGRVGLLAGVLPAAVEAMVRCGASPAGLVAWIGPHACGACYEVPQAMAEQAEALLPGIASRTSWGTPSLDLGRAAASELAGLGVGRVEPVGLCTMTTPSLFSHRRDGPGTGRQVGLVWLAA